MVAVQRAHEVHRGPLIPNLKVGENEKGSSSQSFLSCCRLVLHSQHRYATEHTLQNLVIVKSCQIVSKNLSSN